MDEAQQAKAVNDAVGQQNLQHAAAVVAAHVAPLAAGATPGAWPKCDPQHVVDELKKLRDVE